MKTSDWNKAILLSSGCASGIFLAIGIIAAIESFAPAGAGASTNQVGQRPEMGHFLYDWQTLIAGFLALVAAAAAWHIGRQQATEQRIGSLLSFMVEEKQRCDSILPQLVSIRRWISTPTLYIKIKTMKPSDCRMRILNSLATTPTSKEGSYSFRFLQEIIDRIPKCDDHIWRSKMEYAIEYLHRSGLEFVESSDGGVDSVIDDDSEEIRDALIKFEKFESVIGEEIGRSIYIIETYNRGKYLLVEEIDSIFGQSKE
ncbi:hypothetical protein [Xanthobacter flavus]|uniref:hypothetical protein n=1 Tax=Xanthobacter flavus TaxID=281 RepID=UPI00372BE6D5